MLQLESLNLGGLEMTGEWRRFHVALVIHAPTGLPMSITNLAKLDTLNGQPIKTDKKISFPSLFSSLSSVDAIVAFLVKFNPAVESLDFSKMKNLQSKCVGGFMCGTVIHAP